MIAAAPPPTHAGGSVGMLLTVLGRASTRLFTEALLHETHPATTDFTHNPER